MKNSESKIFEWYKELIELGKYEVEHGRNRFYSTSRLHLSILAGILILSSYSIANDEAIVMVLSILVSFFGIYNAINWLKIIDSSSTWESRWFHTAAEIEETKEFQDQVGTNKIKAWSHEEVKPKLKTKIKNKGKSPKFYKSFVISLIVFYSMFIFGALLYFFTNIFKSNLAI